MRPSARLRAAVTIMTGPRAGDLGALVVSVAAVCLLAGGAPVPLGAGAGLLAWLWLAVRAADRAGRGAVGATGVTARLLLVLSVAVGGGGHAMTPTALVWTGAAAALLAGTAEPLVRRVRPDVEVVGLPGLAAPRTGRLAPLIAPYALLVILAGAALDLGSLPAWPWLAAGLLQLMLSAAAGAQAALARYRRPAATAVLRERLEAYGPVIAIHLARSSSSTYQVRMWQPYLSRLGVPLIILTRDAVGIAPLHRATGLPVICRRTWRDMDDVLVPSLRLAVYVNSVASNADFVTYRQVTHVYLGHGESEKALSTHPAHAMYDKILVAGPAAIDRYARTGVQIPAEKFLVVGRPQTAELVRGPVPASDPSRTSVLYAPTWAGYNAATSYSSLLRAVRIVQTLLDHDVSVVFRPHPFSRRRAAERGTLKAVEELLARDAATSGRRHEYGPALEELTFAECVNRTAAMVCDLSSVITDYLYADRPFAVVETPAAAMALARDATLAAAGLVIAPDLCDLDAVVEELLGADTRSAARADARAVYLGGDAGDPVARFVAAMAEVLESAQPSRGTRGVTPTG